MPGVPQPRVQGLESTRVSPLQVHRITRHSRTRLVLTAYFALSLVNLAFLPPSPDEIIASQA
jgi:hypothetical protein